MEKIKEDIEFITSNSSINNIFTRSRKMASGDSVFYKMIYSRYLTNNKHAVHFTNLYLFLLKYTEIHKITRVGTKC